MSGIVLRGANPKDLPEIATLFCDRIPFEQHSRFSSGLPKTLPVTPMGVSPPFDDRPPGVGGRQRQESGAAQALRSGSGRWHRDNGFGNGSRWGD